MEQRSAQQGSCSRTQLASRYLFFFFNDTATTEIYTLSLHDALPISFLEINGNPDRLDLNDVNARIAVEAGATIDRKSTRLNSSHSQISYAVFCLKKKKGKDARVLTLIIFEDVGLHRAPHPLDGRCAQ